MKFVKLMSVVLTTGIMVTLVACHSARTYDPAAVQDANAAYQGDPHAQSYGAGEETSFGDQANPHAKQKLSQKHVYHFDYDSYVVHEDDRVAILNNANYLLSNPKAKIILEGHTDPRGSREYNIGLGERRAKAVAEILTAKGVSPSQIRFVSYGAEKRAAMGHTEADYQQDRRSVLAFLQR